MREENIALIEENQNYDDTGQRVNGENRWLWFFISKEMMRSKPYFVGLINPLLRKEFKSLYHTSNSRSKYVIVEIFAPYKRRLMDAKLGEDYDGVTVQDFYPSDDKAHGFKQKGRAHLLRDAKDLVDKKKAPDEGAKNRNILMSAIGTMKLQGKTIFDYGKEYVLFIIVVR